VETGLIKDFTEFRKRIGFFRFKAFLNFIDPGTDFQKLFIIFSFALKKRF